VDTPKTCHSQAVAASISWVFDRSIELKEIPLTRGLVALVDDEDYEYLSQFKWSADKKGYAVRRIQHPARPDKQATLRMHRVILGLDFDDPRMGDHDDGNKANNRRYNLRIATSSQNQQNKGANRNNTSGYKGVSFEKRKQRWVANIKVQGKKKYLGSFKTPELAHSAYCAAAIQMHGEYARLS
jgi:hypothetical protein